jgi:hypothetical protein
MARAVFGLTGSTASARPALEQRWQLQAEVVREETRWRDEYWLAIADGDFTSGRAAIERWQKATTTSTDALRRGIPMSYRVQLELELGDTSAAKRAARDFENESRTWVAHDFFDVEAERIRVLNLTDLMTFSEYRSARQLAYDKMLLRAGYFAQEGTRWYEAFVQSTRTSEDAIEAIARSPKIAGFIDAAFRDVGVDEEIGRMFLLANDPHRAIPALRRATKACTFTKSPLRMKAFELLGDSLEKTGDHAGACASYAQVLARWGHESKSTTAAASRAAAMRLHCSMQTKELP